MADTIEGGTLRQFRCFQALSEDEARVARAALRLRRLAPGKVLFRQGEPGRAAYLVRTGRMEVRVAVPELQEDRLLTTVGPGAILGEMSLLRSEPRSAEAVARTRVELWEISQEAFRAALEGGAAWARAFLLASAEALAERLAAVDRQLVALIAQLRQAGDAPVSRVAELEQLRERLFSQWSF